MKIRIFIILLFLTSNSFSIMELELTKGVFKKIPIGLASNSASGASDVIINTIKNDLQISGEMLGNRVADSYALALLEDKATNYPKDNDYLLGFNVQEDGSNLVIRVRFVNVYNSGNILFDKQLTITDKQVNQLAHYISDLIYQKVTGSKGVFSSNIAYVKRSVLPNKSLRYQLMIANMDGKNEQMLLQSKEPISSVSWSPSGDKIAYVSFEKRRAEIYTVEINSGTRNLITSFDGLNGAPQFSPDGDKLALVLSRSGYPNIYQYDLLSHSLRRLTKTRSIDTEPEWSSDGKSIYFTSDRTGTVQIFKLDLASLDTRQVTRQGRYNASSKLIPNTNNILILHRDDNGFNLAVQNLSTGVLKVITRSGHIQNPSIAANGKMVLFTQSVQGKKILKILPLNGIGSYRLRIAGRDIIKPAWGPIT